jgi:hypothetical protein
MNEVRLIGREEQEELEQRRVLIRQARRGNTAAVARLLELYNVKFSAGTGRQRIPTSSSRTLSSRNDRERTK